MCLRSWVLGPNLCLWYQFGLRIRGGPSIAVARAASLQLTELHFYANKFLLYTNHESGYSAQRLLTVDAVPLS